MLDSKAYGYDDVNNFYNDVSLGLIAGARSFNMIGEREGIASLTNGEDIWMGAAATIPHPPDVGEQMTIVSTNVNDTLLGSGVRKVEIHYLDGDGLEQEETIELDGTNPVNTVATDISFVNDFEAVDWGSNGLPLGDITIYKIGFPATVYDILKAGANKSLTSIFKVPVNKQLIIIGYIPTQTGNQDTSIRLRGTYHKYDRLAIGGFLFISPVRLANNPIPIVFTPPEHVPPLAITKATAWAKAANGNGSVQYRGVLIDI